MPCQVFIVHNFISKDVRQKRHQYYLGETDYSDKKLLTCILNCIHTVLSFVRAYQDPGSAIQKNLIDAAVAAGVQRFAPSEWSSSSLQELPWYAEKRTIRAYPKEINQEKKKSLLIISVTFVRFF